MKDRVVLLDRHGDVADIAAELAGLPVTVSAADTVPSGPGIVALLTGPGTDLTPAHIAALPDLRVVAATSAGSDHIPLHAVSTAGAWVTTSAGYCTDEVADHTLALVLGLLRRITELDRSVRRGDWDVQAIPPRRVSGTVLGLAGFGRTGRAVATRASALGMRVAAWGPTTPEAVFREHGVRRHDTLPGLLTTADVISLHLPLTPATEHLVDARALAVMRPGTFLVNVSRGGLVDHEALGEALRDGQLAGAALDVLPAEPPPGETVRRLAGAVLTPHAAWYSPEARVRPFRMAASAVADVLRGREPAGAVARPAALPTPPTPPAAEGNPG